MLIILIRWITLPIICILSSLLLVVAVVIIGMTVVPIEYLDPTRTIIGEYTGAPFIFQNIACFVMSAGLILPILYLAPSHNKLVASIVKGLMLCVYIFLFFFLAFNVEFNLWDTLSAIANLCSMCVGLFIDKVLDLDIDE